jgi:hypothetical protein
MAPNMAMKRAAKANRRKTVVAEKRKSELTGGSLAGQVARAAQVPIQHCLLSGDLRDSGMATLILARGVAPHHLMVGGFLIDAWCLGVKDSFFRTAGAESFGDLIANMAMTAPVEDVDPAYARKLLRDVTAWASSNGFAPHRDFAAVEKLFGDVDADSSDAAFTFGRDGKVTYISGPNDSPAQARFGIGAVKAAIARRLGGGLAVEHQE